MEEWISLREFMKRTKVGNKVALQMIKNKEIECRKTPGGRYKIKIGGDTVNRSMYEDEKNRRIQAETKLNLLKKLINEGV